MTKYVVVFRNPERGPETSREELGRAKPGLLHA
jgi:hypothetical protein